MQANDLLVQLLIGHIQEASSSRRPGTEQFLQDDLLSLIAKREVSEDVRFRVCCLLTIYLVSAGPDQGSQVSLNFWQYIKLMLRISSQDRLQKRVCVCRSQKTDWFPAFSVNHWKQGARKASARLVLSRPSMTHSKSCSLQSLLQAVFLSSGRWIGIVGPAAQSSREAAQSRCGGPSAEIGWKREGEANWTSLGICQWGHHFWPWYHTYMSKGRCSQGEFFCPLRGEAFLGCAITWHVPCDLYIYDIPECYWGCIREQPVIVYFCWARWIDCTEPKGPVFWST